MKKLIGGFILLLLTELAAPAGVLAATATPATGQGLEISPPVIELNANPGQTITTTIRVRNVANGVLVTKAKADDFGAGASEDGQPQLLLNETGETRYSLKYWVQGISDLRLDPQELKTVTVTIAVPTNAEPGGHYGVVRFTGLPPSLEGTGVALSASVGTLILLRVSGTITEKVTLAQFSATQSGKTHSFFKHGPVGFLVRVKNEGTVHEKVTGAVTVTNTFGKTIGTVKVNSTGNNVLPDSIRRYDQALASKQLFGHYHAKLVMTYAGGQVMNSTIGFWVIPWTLILLILLGLAVVIWLIKLGFRRYNAHIIAQARKANK